MNKIILLFFLSTLTLLLKAQELNYVQYDTKDGLAGSTVYDMCQDEDGFMWFGTENGLTRFDGTIFKNFTVKDGLPDNEVLKLFPDSKGRLWIGTFNKDVCYYYKGKIYNKGNTEWLNKINLSSAALSFSEDNSGILMISDLQNLFELKDTFHIENIINKPFLKKYKGEKVFATANFFDGGFFIIIHDSAFKLKGDRLVFFNPPTDLTDKTVVFKRFANGESLLATLPASKIRQTFNRNVATFVSTVDGAWSIDTINSKLKNHFLPGKKVSNTFIDIEGNTWFSTLGDGVYRLPSLNFKNIELPKKSGFEDCQVYSLEGDGEDILCGLGFSSAVLLNNNKIKNVINYEDITLKSVNNSLRNKLHTSKVLHNGDAILGFDAFLLKISSGLLKVGSMIAIKSIDQIDDNYIVVGTHNNAYKMSIEDLNVVDTIYSGRCTKVIFYNNKYYVGTPNGLYEINKNRQITYLGNLNYSLTRRITDIKPSANGLLWVATNDAGIVAIKNHRVVIVKKDTDGLSSNICKSLFALKNNLYVGTNKGINRLNINLSNSRILRYGYSDGLPSDIINAIYVKESMVYVASPKGLTYFDEDEVSNSSICRLYMENIVVSGVEYQPTKKLELSYKDNNIKFSYTAVSFKSGGDILYYYKLDGLDHEWKKTSENSLEYQTLPSGNYKLHLFAVNKFGLKSAVLLIPFYINTPFYKTIWFAISLIFLVFGFIVFFFYRRNKLLEKKLIEKNNFEKAIADLEQQALQAQMNPHFIFNCLNSIQQFILLNDKQKANQYLTGFASLIRQTLNISSKKSVTVVEEVEYLKKYLEMEKMRFGNSFEFEIVGHEDPHISRLQLPALLLQPYVENSLKHGLRYKEQGTGKSIISFAIEHEHLVCRVIDNGVGRERAAQYKSKMPSEYQSKGISLTARRIDLLNKLYDSKISYVINDLVNVNNEAIGTEVIVKIPV